MQGNDAFLIFSTRASAAFAQQVALSLGVGLAPVEEREFAGGEHKIRPLQDVHGREVFIVQQLHADAAGSVNDKLCRLLFFIGALRDAGAAAVTVCLPYLPYARKDRRTQPRDPVTTRYVATLFEAVGTECIVTLDVHNEAAFDNAFRIPTVRLEAAATFADAIAALVPRPTRIVVASPDVGGIKRAHRLRTLLAARLGRSVGTAFMEKAREADVLSGDVFVGDVQGAEVILYDDLIASGATLLRAAQAARQSGAQHVYAAATHVVADAAADRLLAADGIDVLLVSDSLPLPDSWRHSSVTQARLHTISVAPLFAKVIRHLQTGAESMS